MTPAPPSSARDAAPVRFESGREIGRYVVREPIAVGGMAIVYRASDRYSGRDVALKTVDVPDEELLSSIRREVRVLQRLDHPGIVRMLESGTTSGIPWVAMELISGLTLAEQLRRTWSSWREADGPSAGRPPAAAGRLEGALRIALQVVDSLEYVHGEGIVHGDLKPGNILLREDGQVVLADFGVAMTVRTAVGTEPVDVLLGRPGTVHYMSPEQILGEAIDARSDLYSLGCILFEIVAGQPPFLAGSAGEVLRRHLSSAPPRTSALVREVPAGLDDLIAGLLEKRPVNRIGHATDLADLLRSVAGQPAPLARRARPAAILYRPTLTGREATLKQLASVIRGSAEGKGAIAVVSGESGIGKTYIVKEAARLHGDRHRIIASAARPPQGTKGGDTSSAPMHLLRPLLHAVVDYCLQEGEEATRRIVGGRAKLLAMLEGSIAELPHVPREHGQDEPHNSPPRDLVVSAVKDTLGAFAAHGPIMLLLDDVQWADELSWELLTSLTRDWLTDKPILVVATIREEEGVSGRAEALATNPAVKGLRLAGLEREGIEAIVREMLALREAPGAAADFFGRQAFGNPFLVAEYLRAAVGEGLLIRDSAGRLRISGQRDDLSVDAFRSMPLPTTIQKVVHHRLARLSSPARNLACVGAAHGGLFSFGILRDAAGLAEAETFDAVTELLSRQVFEEVGPSRYRFLHDKLAEVVYEMVSERERGSLHRSVAMAMERRTAQGLGPPDAAALAHHFRLAKDVGRELRYTDLAAEEALSVASYEQAARLFRRAIEIAPTSSRSSPYSDSRGSRREHGLAIAAHGTGDLAVAERHALGALRSLGHRVPMDGRNWLSVLLAESGKQAWHLFGPRLPRTSSLAERADLLEGAHAAALLMHRYFYAENSLGMLATSLVSVNLAERAGAPSQVPRSYLAPAMFTGILRLRKLSSRYFEQAERASASTTSADMAYTLCAKAVYHGTFGQWRQAEAEVDAARHILGEAEDPFVQEMVLTTSGHVDYFMGRIAFAAEKYEQLLARARARKNLQTTAWGLFSVARSLVAMGRFESALANLEEASGILERQPELQSEIIVYGLHAETCMRLGDERRALESARTTLSRIRHSAPAGFPPLVGYCSVLEVLFELAARAASERERAKLHAERRTALSALRRFATLIPAARPASLRYRGREAVCEGTRGAIRSARARLDESLALARAWGTPHDEALAHKEISTLFPQGSTERQHHQAECVRLFGAMGCARELELSQTTR
ncbi:MAG: protein kinase [Polyangiaceae bacterium]